MAIICRNCGRNIDVIDQDNMSYSNNPVCEDCDEEDEKFDYHPLRPEED